MTEYQKMLGGQLYTPRTASSRPCTGRPWSSATPSTSSTPIRRRRPAPCCGSFWPDRRTLHHQIHLLVRLRPAHHHRRELLLQLQLRDAGLRPHHLRRQRHGGPQLRLLHRRPPPGPHPPGRGAGVRQAHHRGDSVWIGGGVTVLPGVTIGSRAVIGGGSVVVHDIPEGVVAVGNPCRPIRTL